MTSRVLSRGHGAAGAVAYVAHDAPNDEDPRPTTHGRVAGVAFRGGLPEFDPTRGREEQLRLVSRVMQATAADAKHLKRLAGVSAAGRPCTAPIKTFALGWEKGARPTWRQMEAAGDSWLKAQRLQHHRFVMVGHVEEGVPRHLQLVGCMVSPIDGTAHTVNHALTGSKWAQQWEQEHGGIVIETRVERNRLRDELAQTKRQEEQHAANQLEYAHSISHFVDLDRKRAEIQEAKRARIAEARAAVRARMPATEPTRSCGGRSQLTAEDRAECTRTHQRQRRERRKPRPTTRAGRRAHAENQAALAVRHRAERRELAREQRARRRLHRIRPRRDDRAGRRDRRPSRLEPRRRPRRRHRPSRRRQRPSRRR